MVDWCGGGRGAGALIPEELVAPQQYNLSVHLSWGHFLTVRGKTVPTHFAASSAATFTALRSTTCLVLHSQGLNYSQVWCPPVSTFRSWWRLHLHPIQLHSGCFPVCTLLSMRRVCCSAADTCMGRLRISLLRCEWAAHRALAGHSGGGLPKSALGKNLANMTNVSPDG